MKNYKQLINELPSKSIVFTFGRFNPPSLGHELTIKVVRKLAKQRKADHVIFVCSSYDAKKNPLESGKKLQYLEMMFPNTRFISIKEEADMVKYVSRYKNAVLVTSSDKVTYYKKQFKTNNLHTFEVVPAGSKDSDSDDRLLKLASKGNYLSFRTHLPTTVRELDAKRLMNDVRSGMGLEPIKEQLNLVKDDLREQYFRGDIFNEGDIVESSDIVYKIIKRGSNHLLLQTEEGTKVSKWIQDVKQTERNFMPNIKESVSDQSTVKIDVQGQAEVKKQALKLKQVEDAKKFREKQDQERSNLEASLKTESAESPVVKPGSKYNIARSIMSLNDYRKMVGAHHGEEDREHENNMDHQMQQEIPLPATQLHMGHTMANDEYGHHHRRMKVKYKVHSEETEVQSGDRKAQLKRFKDQAADAKLTEAQYAGLEKEDKPGKKATEFKGTRNSVTGKTVEGWKDEDIGFKHTKTTAVKEDLEFPEINEEEFTSQVQSDLDSLAEEEFFEAYDDEELAIIDEETGEEIEAVAEEVELDAPALMEVLSRHERVMAKARMRRNKTKMQRREMVAVRRLSTPEVANKRARRMAISAMKKRLLKGRNPQKVSVGEKERVERFIAQRKKIVDRLAARMVSRVKQVEKARMSHKKFTKPNNGVSF